jgi:O-antigen/teichoic acid export membrane protein
MRNSIVGGVANLAGDLVALPLFGVPGVAVVSVLSAALFLFLNYRSAVSLDLVPRFRSVFGPGEPAPALPATPPR